MVEAARVGMAMPLTEVPQSMAAAVAVVVDMITLGKRVAIHFLVLVVAVAGQMALVVVPGVLGEDMEREMVEHQQRLVLTMLSAAAMAVVGWALVVFRAVEVEVDKRLEALMVYLVVEAKLGFGRIR